jgi:hypothetical protein
VYHTDGYVAEGVDVDACDVADAADGVHVVEVVNVTAVVGRINVDDAGI